MGHSGQFGPGESEKAAEDFLVVLSQGRSGPAELSRGVVRCEGAAGVLDLACVEAFDLVPESRGPELGISHYFVDVVEGARGYSLLLGLEPQLLLGMTQAPIQDPCLQVLYCVRQACGIVQGWVGARAEGPEQAV